MRVYCIHCYCPVWRSDNTSHAWFYFLQSGEKYDAKADLWSVGTVLFEMISGKAPFHGDGSLSVLLRNMKTEAARLPADVRVSKECVKLLNLTLDCKPHSRTDFEGFLEASEAFVALGCNGTPPPEGSTAPLNEIPSTSGQQIVDRNVCVRMNLRAISENDGMGVPIVGEMGEMLSAYFGRNSAADVQVAVEFSGNNGHHFKRILKIIEASTGKTIKTVTLLSTWTNIAFSTLADGTIIYRIGNKISVYLIAFEKTEYNTTEMPDFQNTRLIEFLDDTTVVIVTKKNVYHWNIRGTSRPVLVLSNHEVVCGSNTCYTSSPDKRSALISTSKMFRLIDFPNTVGGAIRGRIRPTSYSNGLPNGTVGGVISIDGTILSTSYFKCRNNTCIAVCFVKKGVVLMRGWNEEGNIVLETTELAVDQPSTSFTARHSMHSYGESLVLLLTNGHESNTRIYTFNFSLDMASRKFQITQSPRQIELSGQLIATHASEGGVFVVTNEGVLSLPFRLITVSPPLNSDASSTDDEISSVNSTEDEEEFDSVDNDSNVDNDKQDNDPSVSDDNSDDDDNSNLGDKLNQIPQDVEDENGDKQNSNLCSESEDEKRPDPPVTPGISQAVDPPAGLASPLRMSPQDASPPNSARPSIASTPSPASSSRSTAKNQAFSPASSEEDNDAKSLVSTSSIASSSGNSDNAEGNDSDDDPTASVASSSRTTANHQAFSPDSSLDLEGSDAASIASTSPVASSSGNRDNTSSSISSYEESDDDSDDDSAASGASSSSSESNSNALRTRAGGRLRNIQRNNYKEPSSKQKLRREDLSGEEDDENREEDDETESESALQDENREEESAHDDESENEDNQFDVGEVGYKFFKRFEDGWYQGTVTKILYVKDPNFDLNKKKWLVCACKYDDNDTEDLEPKELEELKAVEEAALAGGDVELLRKIAELQDDDA